MSRLELSIAWRYLRSRRGSRLLSFISVIAIGGVIVGVSALIVVMGVMNGLQRDLREKILVGSPDIRVLRYGKDLRIDDWQAELKPAQKIAWLDARAAEGRKVLMAGDGLNDAPALAAAHASISPSSAADISQRTADFVFQGEKLAPVLEAIAVGKRARSMALQNFAVALVYNVICVPLAVAGFVTPLIAAIVMSTSSILVTANAARLVGRGRT